MSTQSQNIRSRMPLFGQLHIGSTSNMRWQVNIAYLQTAKDASFEPKVLLIIYKGMLG